MLTNLRFLECIRFFSLKEASDTFQKSIGCLWLAIGLVQVCLMRLYFSNIYFLDDIPRAFFGNGWNPASRPLSTLTMQALSMGSFIQDLSPITQISGSIIVTLSAYILSLSFLDQGTNKLLRIIFILIISLNPYILEIYTFRYDSLPYSIGFFFAASSYFALFELIPHFNNRLATLGIMVAATCLCMGSLYYQPAISLFLVVGALKLCMLGISEPLSSKQVKLTVAFLSCIGSSLFIAKISQLLLITKDSWISSQSQFTPTHLFTNIYSNTSKAWKVFQFDWFSHFNIFSLFVTLVLVNTVLLAIAFAYKTAKSRNISKNVFAQYLFSSLCLLAGCTLGLYGFSAVLDNPHMQPRTFFFSGVTLAVLLFLPYSLGLCRNLYTTGFLSIIASIGAISVLTFSLIWGNAMAAQDLHQNAVYGQLAQDIYSLKKNQGKIAFENRINFSPSISKITLTKYPLINRELGNLNDGWQYKRLRLKTGLPISKADTCSHGNQALLLDRLNYSISDCNSQLVITFKERS